MLTVTSDTNDLPVEVDPCPWLRRCPAGYRFGVNDCEDRPKAVARIEAAEILLVPPNSLHLVPGHYEPNDGPGWTFCGGGWVVYRPVGRKP